MPEAPFQLSKPSLAYAKLVATPTDTSWSQVYNAGNLFACVSLTIEDAGAEDISLPAIGKQIIDTLQTEFFTLDKKNIESISDVIRRAVHHVSEPVVVDLSLGFFKDNTLYLFLIGRGRVIMKRLGKTGVLLESKKIHKEIITASGYLHNEDTVVLETKQFADDINDEALATALDLALPNDIAEALSPKLHENSDGGQAAIIVVYHGVSGGAVADVHPIGEDDEEEESIEPAPPVAAPLPSAHAYESRAVEDRDEDDEDDEIDEDEEFEHVREPGQKRPIPIVPAIGTFISGIFSKVHLPAGSGLSHRRKLFLSIAIVLIVILAVSIFFTKKKQSDEQQQVLFKQIYETAKSKYDAGQGLETLNRELSTEDYLEAKKILSDGSGKFAPGSTEARQIQELLAKINAELSESSPVENAKAKEVKPDENSLLAVAKANSDGLGFTQDGNNVYFVTDSAIVSVSKSTGTKTDLIKNDKNWEDAIGLAAYEGNFYVLDRNKGIVKFVPGGGGYGASSYFKDKPSMASANALAIDSSIWIVMKDGRILKYTSGTQDTFKGPTLQKAIANPVKIFTDANTDNAYILDRGSSRIVKFSKEGTAHTEFTSAVLKNAQELEVSEKDKKVTVLSGGKFYEISL